MTRRGWLATAGGLLLLAMALAFVLSETTTAVSSLSSGPHGWLAARRYLEQRGNAITLRDRPLHESSVDAEVLVMSFPLRLRLRDDEIDALTHWVEAGGALLIGYGSDGAESFAERRLLRRFGYDRADLGPPPRRPDTWRRWASREWDLSGRGPLAAAAPLRVSALRFVATPPANAVALYGNDRALISEMPLGRGRVVVLPGDALSNRRLAGNADLLETLRGLGHRWVFDEYHHGLQAPLAGQPAQSQRALDVFVWQLLLAYLLGLVALSRRFGPPWRDPPIAAGTTAAFLVGLGTLHHRLGHHAQAARALIQRARELDPRLRLPDLLERDADRADSAGLLSVARTVARGQAGAARRR